MKQPDVTFQLSSTLGKFQDFKEIHCQKKYTLASQLDVTVQLSSPSGKFDHSQSKGQSQCLEKPPSIDQDSQFTKIHLVCVSIFFISPVTLLALSRAAQFSASSRDSPVMVS